MPGVQTCALPISNERETDAWNKATEINKTDFAMKYSILDTDWTTPRYIEEGLRWLADNMSATAKPDEEIEATTAGTEKDADA